MLRRKARTNRRNPKRIPQYTEDMAHLLGEGRRKVDDYNTLLFNNKVLLRKGREAVLFKQVEKGVSG